MKSQRNRILKVPQCSCQSLSDRSIETGTGTAGVSESSDSSPASSKCRVPDIVNSFESDGRNLVQPTGSIGLISR